MSRQPLDKGRVAYIAEKYQSNQRDPQSGQPVNKNRYATVGRATKWANQQGESVELELDTMPIGHSGSLKLFIFWDSNNNNAQQVAPQQYSANQAQGGYQPAPPQQAGQPAPQYR